MRDSCPSSPSCRDSLRSRLVNSVGALGPSSPYPREANDVEADARHFANVFSVCAAISRSITIIMLSNLVCIVTKLVKNSKICNKAQYRQYSTASYKCLSLTLVRFIELREDETNRSLCICNLVVHVFKKNGGHHRSS